MQGSKRVGILIPEFPGQTHIFFWREMQALRELGADLEIISTRKPRAENFHDFHSEISSTFYLTSLSVFKILLFCLSNLTWLYRSIRYCIMLNGGLKVKFRTFTFILFAANLIVHCKAHSIGHVHVHSSADAAHIVAIASFYNQFTYSICIHGNLNQYGDNHASKFSRAAFIVTVTKPLIAEVSKTSPGLDENQIALIPMGVDIGKFRPSQVPREENSPYIITSVSRLAHVKGHVYALRALAKLPSTINFRYKIVGDGDMRSTLEQEAKNLNISDKVEFLGFKKENEVYEILQTTDVFMLTSFGFGEAAPVAIMEAMACGVAPICSIIGGTTDMITHEHDGKLVKQKSVDEIALALENLLTDTNKLKETSINARNTAVTQFCHRRSASKLFDKIQLALSS